MTRWTKIFGGVVFGSALLVGGTIGPVGAAPTPTTTRVMESSLKDGYPSRTDNNWYREDTRPGGSVSVAKHLVSATDTFGGPPGFGDGALALTTNTSTYAKAQLLNHSLQGTALGDVSTLEYWTFQSSSTGRPDVDDASLQLRIDTDGDLSSTADQTNLVYEPYENGAGSTDPQQALDSDVWQHWVATGGDWWSSKQITCGDFSLAPGAGGPPYSRPSEVAANCPNAVVVAIGVNVGSFNPNYVVGVDGIHVVTTSADLTYDFGPK